MRDVRKALTRARLVGLRGRARRLEAPPEWRAESPARALSAGMRRPQPAGDRTESAAWREPCKRASRWGARRGSPTRGSPMTQRAMTQRVTDARSRVVGPAPRRRCSHPNPRFNYRFRRGAVCVYSRSHARSRREWISHLKRGRASAQRNPERARARDAPRDARASLSFRACSSARCPRRGSSCGPPSRAIHTARSALRNRRSSGRRARWGPRRPRPRTRGAPCRPS